MIRLLVVESRPAVRKGLHMRLAAEADLSVIGEASDAQIAVDMSAALHPDVVLMDVEMPHDDATANALCLICQQVPVIILSMHDDALTRARAKEAGAAAFVAKAMPAEALLATIRQVADTHREVVILQ
jgi:two-component system, NarL family, invasion response regulator UvrY